MENILYLLAAAASLMDVQHSINTKIIHSKKK